MISRRIDRIVLAFSLSLAVLTIACGPEKRVQWSPDGKSAAVISDGTLFLTNEQGAQSRSIAEGVVRMSWLPDSARILAVTEKKVKSWDELARLAPVDFREKESIAAAQTLTEELLGYEGQIGDFKPSNAAALTGEQWASALLYIKRQGDMRLKQKLGEKDWKDLEDLEVEVRGLRVVSTTTEPMVSGQFLLRTMEDIAEPRISPDGTTAAIVTKHMRGWFGSGDTVLSVISLSTGSVPVQIADHVSENPDWTPDGGSLVFIRCGDRLSEDSDRDSIGLVGRRAVRDKAGAISVGSSPVVELARVLFQDGLKVRCMRDGKILFSANELSLPAEAADFPGRMTLFVIQPGTPVAVKRLLPDSKAQALPDRADLFELSPNQQRIAVPGSKGRISVVSLETGEIEPVVDKDGPDDLATVPVWRNDAQLCFAALSGPEAGSVRRPEIVLWSQSQPRNIVLPWPDASASGLK